MTEKVLLAKAREGTFGNDRESTFGESQGRHFWKRTEKVLLAKARESTFGKGQIKDFPNPFMCSRPLRGREHIKI